MKNLVEVLDDESIIVVEYEKGEEDINRYDKARQYLKKLGY